MEALQRFLHLLGKRLLTDPMALGDLIHAFLRPANQPVAIRDRVQLDHWGRAVGDVGQHGADAFGVAVVVEIACFAFHLKSHVLALHDVDGLRPAQIRMLPPPPHYAFGEDVLWLLDVLGSGYLKNWVIGVDASG